MKMIIPEGRTVRDVVRIAGTELNGNKPIGVELRKIPGVNWRFAHAICMVLNINKWQALGSLNDEELEKLEDCIKNPQKYGIPEWMINRRLDPKDGKNKHLVGADLEFAVNSDKRREIELKTYKGERYKYGLPVRGQKTRSHHRKRKKPAMKKTEQPK